jgi:hypothetical protein
MKLENLGAPAGRYRLVLDPGHAAEKRQRKFRCEGSVVCVISRSIAAVRGRKRRFANSKGRFLPESSRLLSGNRKPSSLFTAGSCENVSLLLSPSESAEIFRGTYLFHDAYSLDALINECQTPDTILILTPRETLANQNKAPLLPPSPRNARNGNSPTY